MESEGDENDEGKEQGDTAAEDGDLEQECDENEGDLIQHLIDNVRKPENSFIYNKKEKDHAQRATSFWLSVAKLAHNVRDANWFKTKWKSLVGSFDRSHKRRTKNPTGSAGAIAKRRNWPWYEQLLFLKDRTVVRGKYLHNAFGAVDGKHIHCQKLDGVGSLCYNYKLFNSVALLAVCDAYGRFLFVDIGAYGGSGDGRILEDTEFYKQMLSGELQCPDSRPLPGTDEPLDCFVVGDSAFQHHVWLQKGYALSTMRKLDAETIRRLIYNYRLCRARRIIEDGFGWFAMEWRIFRTEIVAGETLLNLIISAACCLHNFLLADIEQRLRRKPNLVDNENTETGEVVDGTWRKDVGASVLASAGRARRTERGDAVAQRERLADWFLSEAGRASAPWQAKSALGSKSADIVRSFEELRGRVAAGRAKKSKVVMAQQKQRVARLRVRQAAMPASVADASAREQRMASLVDAVASRLLDDAC